MFLLCRESFFKRWKLLCLLRNFSFPVSQVHKIQALDTNLSLTKPHAKSHCVSKTKFSISLLFYAYLSRAVAYPLGSNHFHTDL